MMKKKRFLSAFLALVMVLSLLPVSALAAPAESIVYLDEEERAQYDGWLSDRLGLMLLGDGMSLFSTGDYIAGDNLISNTKKYYDAVAAKLPNIAANGGSTKFTVPGAAQLNKEEASKLFHALCFDFPYEMYWRGSSCGYGTKGVFNITVSDDYRSESDQYTVDSVKAKAASEKITAAGGAVQTILSTAEDEGLADLEKLVYFKEEICRLVAYHDVAADWPEDKYGDPWQLIYVFDGNSNTKVVCEGYAKAFQYLCDLSLSTAQCYTVSGKMDGSNHMWNIVTLDGGKYLVDVTNCDGFTKTAGGSSGYPFGLFLAGASGSPKDGYTVTTAPGPFKYLWIGSNSQIIAQPKEIKYTYDNDTVWGNAALTLSGTSYPVRFYDITETELNAGSTYTWTPLLKQGFTFAAAPQPDNVALPSGVSVASNGTITYKPTAVAEATDMTIEITYGNNAYPYYYTLGLPPVTTSYGVTLTAGERVVYGDSLTVGVTGLGQDGTVKLYYGQKELTSAAVSGGTATLTYATKDKGLSIGAHRLTVKYFPGTEARAVNLGTVAVTLTPKKLTGSIGTGFTKEYDGIATFTVPVTLDGIVDGDTVTATADVTIGNADAGVKQISSATVKLSGKDAGYYAAPDSVGGTVTITKKNLELSNIPEQTVYSGQETANKTVELPVLPEGASYGAITVEPESALISGTPTRDGKVLTFSTTSQAEGATATINIAVSGGQNYNNGTVTVTVSAVAKQDANVKFNGTVSESKTFGDKPFTLYATAYNPGTAGSWTWSWSSSDPEVLSVEGRPFEATVTVKKAGTATITATYESDTTKGSAATAITVNKAVPTVTAPGPKDLTYNRQEQALVTPGSATGGTMMYAVERNKQQDGQDEQNEPDAQNREYSDNIPTGTNAGEYTVYYKVVGDGDHGDIEPRSVQVTIKPKPIADAEVEEIDKEGYTGSAIKPTVRVKDGETETELVKDSDYTVTYKDNTNAGTGTVTVTGKGNYGGSKEVSFTIKPKDLSEVSVRVSVDDQTYNGSPIEPDVEVKVGGTTLEKDKDYTVEYSDNTNAGEATVTVTGLGNYTGSEMGIFHIQPAGSPGDITLKKNVLLTETDGRIPLPLPEVKGSLGEVTYEGSVMYPEWDSEAIEAEVEVVDGETGAELHYTIEGTPKDGDVITFTVWVSPQNYDGFEIKVEIRLLENLPQDTLTVKPVSTVYPNTVTLTTEGGNGDGAVTYEVVKGGDGDAVIGEDGVLTPTKAGTVKVVATKAGDDTYLEAVSKPVEIVIKKGAATVKADDKRMAAGQEPPKFTYAIDPADVAVTGVTAACEAGASSAAGTYDITVTGPDVSDDGNYDVTYVKGTLTVDAVVHKHSWATAWSSNGTHHWHECAAGGCDVAANSGKDGYAEHIPGDWIVDKAAASTAEGSRHKECTVCGYKTQTETIPATGGATPSQPNEPSWSGTTSRPNEPGWSGTTSRPNEPGWSGTTSKPDTSSAPVTTGQTTARPDVTTQGIMATAAVSSVMGNDMIAQAKRDGSDSVVIAPEMWDGATKSKVFIPAETVERIGTRTDASLTVSTPIADVTIPNGALAEMGRDAGADGEILVTASVTGMGSHFMTYEVDVTKNGKEISAGQASGIAVSVPVSAAKKARSGLTVKTPAAEATFPRETVVELGRDATLGVAVTVKNGWRAGLTAYDVSVLKGGEPAGALARSVKVSLPVSEQNADAALAAMLVDRYGNETPVPKSFVAGDGRLYMVVDNSSATVVLKNNGRQFADAGEISGWAKDAVEFVSSRNLLRGTGDGSTFSPKTTMQKAMLVSVLHRIEGEPETTGGTGFSDVAPGSWYAGAAAWAYEKGIVDRGESFGGNENVTRQDLAVILYRYATAYGANKGESADISGMAGASGVTPDAVAAMKWAVGAGIVTGSNNGLEPGRAIRRDEASAMLMRFVKYLAK